jgi:hypothetical protein
MKTFNFLLCTLIVLFVLGTHRSFGQGRNREDIEVFKTAFISRKVNLTPEEAKAFWPVYDQYQSDLETLRKRRRDEMRPDKMDFEQLGDKELEKLVDFELEFRQKELDLLKKYHPQFKQILPVRKVARLYKAEEEFKRELLKRIRDRRN